MTLGQLKRRANAIGIFGNGGGWLTLPNDLRFQGWYSLGFWLDQIRPRLPENLKEIAEGRRVGIPTLSRKSRLEVAAGLLSGREVSWRD